MSSSKDARTRQDAAATPEPFDEESHGDEEPTFVVVKRPPAKKDTRRWCRGKVGREHTPVIDVPLNAAVSECGWRPVSFIHPERSTSLRYQCRHAEICSACRKVLRERPFFWWVGAASRHIPHEYCPDFTPLHWLRHPPGRED